MITELSIYSNHNDITKAVQNGNLLFDSVDKSRGYGYTPTEIQMMKDLNDDSPLQNQINALIRSGYTAEEIFDKVSNTNEFKELSNIYGFGALDIYNNIYNEQSLSVDTANGIIDETAKRLDQAKVLVMAATGGYAIYSPKEFLVGMRHAGIASSVNLLFQGVLSYYSHNDLSQIDLTNTLAAGILGYTTPYSLMGGVGAYNSRLQAEKTMQTQLNNARTANKAQKLTDRINNSANTRDNIYYLTGSGFIMGQAATTDNKPNSQPINPSDRNYGKELNVVEWLIQKTLPPPTNKNDEYNRCKNGVCK